MGKKSDKLKRVVKKLASRYGKDDADVQRLQQALDILDATAPEPETRQFRPGDPSFMTRAKQLYYAAASASMH